MAFESGGYSEKFGNRYEANWVANLLLQLLMEKILSVTVEPLGDDETGVDIIIEHNCGNKEYHQCKASNANSEYWSLSQLNKVKILENALYQIERGTKEFHLISPLTSKKLSDLSGSALNSSGNISEFYEYQIKSSEQRQKDFHNLCKYLNLDWTEDTDLNRSVNFLQRFKVSQYIANRHSASELEDKATLLYSGQPSKLINFLKIYPVEFNKLRVKITAPVLQNDLINSGFTPRIQPDDDRVTPVLHRISKDFESSIKPYLISGTIIHRKEVSCIKESLENHAVILIKAEAGIGKSALLLELHESIQSQGTISIPIRLDRNRPENNADAFGVKLGFPYSPVLCMSRFARNKKTVIILDQLDAIRWTIGHSNNALQVCQELVRQTLALRKDGIDINIVLACRNFDLDDDIALGSWINELGNEVSKVTLAYLNSEIVTKLVKPFELFENLSTEKQKILTIPLWLSIYLLIANKISSAPRFDNKLELVKRFWEDRISQVLSLGISQENANRLIEEIVILMNSKSQLSVSENVITVSSSQTVDAFISVGILTKQTNQISFRHQALFDYQIGQRLFNAALKSPDLLIKEIGDLSQQTLTKREHLKYALSMLLDYDQKEFCSISYILLTNNDIRFHLKHLVFSSIKELTSVRNPARKMLCEIAGNSEFRSFFISISCYGNHHIINELSDLDIISGWLNDADDNRIERTIRLLHSIAEKAPSTVLKELTPFIGKSEKWNKRIYKALCWDIHNDSDEMFGIRKKLIELGCNAEYINWKKLANSSPDRALELIEMLLDHYKDALCAPRYSFNRNIRKLSNRDAWSEAELDELENISLTIPQETLSRLLRKISNLVRKAENEKITLDWLYYVNYSSLDSVSIIIKGIFSIIESAGKQLSNNPSNLLELLNPYLNSNSPVITHLVAKLLFSLPIEYSDLVIKWLLDNPELRLTCGNDYIEPRWKLPGKLIDKFSLECSNNNFKSLDKEIYHFKSMLDKEEFKWRLEARRSGIYYCIWGEAQHFLLPTLAPDRTNSHTKQLINVLKRRFKGFKEEDFCSAYRGTGGLVISPLPQSNVLSDKAWKKLILASKERTNKRKIVQCGKDRVAESSIEQFSSSLDIAVRYQPFRFANLALTLPSDIDKQYINAFYRGLQETNVNNVANDYRERWQACPPELIEKVIKHFEKTDCDQALVHLLEHRIEEEGWTINTRNKLIDLAINAEDPKPNKLNVRNSENNELADEADINLLSNNAINCCRGVAYRGISRLFWQDEKIAKDLKYLIQNAIDDPHPAVNLVALDLLLPMLNYDLDLALSSFIKLCNKDLRMTCGHDAFYFFNHGFQGNFRNQFTKLVLKMFDSPLDEIKKQAGREIFARWFFNDLFQDKLNCALHGDINHRKGIASVMKQFLCEDNFHGLMHKLPPIYIHLVNDDKEVSRVVGNCINHENFWNKTISKELFSEFVSSKAALYCLFEFFDAIEKHSGNLIDHQDQLLKLIDNITSVKNSDNSMEHLDIRESSLIRVMQKLYDEATADEDSNAINNCLDIWDKLLKSEIYSAINASKNLEKGLLN